MRQDPTGMLDMGVSEGGCFPVPKDSNEPKDPNEDTKVGDWSTIDPNLLPEVVVTPDKASEPSTSEVSESDVNFSYSEYQKRYPEFLGMSQLEARAYWEEVYQAKYEAYWGNAVKKEREKLALEKLKYFLAHVYAGEELIYATNGYGVVNAVFRTSSGQILKRSLRAKEIKKILRANNADTKIIDELASEAAMSSAKIPVGRSGNVMSSVAKNSPTTIGGRKFTGHALDQMQARGITSPTAVLDVIKNPARTFSGNRPGTTVFIRDNLKVVTNKAGDVMTVIWQ